jgi:predicted NBD/HSP70 family sugar kinase
MYLGIDTGGTKTLVCSLTNDGAITETIKFPTPQRYADYIQQLEESINSLHTKEFKAAGIAVPGRVNREHGTGVAFGNLPWKNVPLQADLERITKVPVVLENDANAAGVSEAHLLKHEFSVVLYVTIGTGIGTAIMVDCKLDDAFLDTEGGQMLLEYQGKLAKWESFASGHAIFDRFGKKASEIEDPETWKAISFDIARGMIELIVMVQPDVIVLGGGIGTHYHKYKEYLGADLRKFATPLTEIPPIRQAQRPEEAVVYGCYDLAKARYGHAA